VKQERDAQTATETLHQRPQHRILFSSPLSTPFEVVFADFFDYGGRHYLVVGDRLSGWVEVLSSTAGTNLRGSAGLVRHLRSFFATFGVPEELSSDVGLEFTAGETEFPLLMGCTAPPLFCWLSTVQWQSRSCSKNRQAPPDV